MAVEKKYAPTLNLIYLPHLDYGLQRVGPNGDMAKDLREIDALFEEITGVEHVLDAVGKREFGIHHERSGELVLISEKDAWFTYYYWEDDDSAPDYARTVNIHSKPGYDPCELFIDPRIPFPKMRIAWKLLRKMLGFRYLLDVIPLDAAMVRGSHGRMADAGTEGPILMTSEPRFVHDSTIEAQDVFHLIERHLFSN